MSMMSVVSSLAALAVVFGLLFLGVALLRRYAPMMSRRGGAFPMEVVQRMSLGARQGLAVVRVGDKHIVVSIGDGGVRFVADADAEAENDAAAVEREHVASVINEPFDAASRFRQLLRSSTFLARSVLLSAALAGAAQAQNAAPSPAPSINVPARAANAAPSAKAAPSMARVDSMIGRLAPQMQLSVGSDKAGGLKLSGTVGIVIMMGLLTLLPAVVLMMTGFTRILIVLGFLRQAIGAQSAPPMQLVAGLALLLTLFVMGPTLNEVNNTALRPWMDGKMTQATMMKAATQPLRSFMLRQTSESDLEMFVGLSHSAPVERAEDVPLVVLTSAFVTSELRVAFQIGFALFLPFIVIDIVVAAVLMSMGMMMVPPAMISLPFKLLLFVLVDGWALVVQGLVRSFH